MRKEIDILKKRLFLGILCILLAAVAAFVVSPLLSSASESRVTVIRVRTNLSRGHCLEESDLEEVEVSAYHLQTNAVTSVNQAVGCYAACDLKAGQTLLQSHLSSTGETASDVLATLDGTKQAISVTIGTLAAGLSGKLQNGDIISVLSYRDGITSAPPELTYVRVITSTTADGIDQDELAENDDGSRDLPVTVTLLVTPRQAALLVQLEHSGSLHLELVYRGEEAVAERFLQAQDDYLNAADAAETGSDTDAEAADDLIPYAGSIIGGTANPSLSGKEDSDE